LVCAILAVCAPQLWAQERLTPQHVQEIRELSATTLTKEGLPGLAIAVSKGDQVWSAGFGSADLEQNVPVDSRSLFRTASISKWMTATAAMRLAEEGKLNPDAPIQQYSAEAMGYHLPRVDDATLGHTPLPWREWRASRHTGTA